MDATLLDFWSASPSLRLLAALLVFLFALWLLVRLWRRHRSGQPDSAPGYERAGALLGENDRAFYRQLAEAVGSRGQVFARVQAASVVLPRKGMPRRQWQQAFGRLAMRRFEFVICHAGNGEPQVVIDTGNEARRGDPFLKDACQAAGVPVVRLDPDEGLSVAAIGKKLEPFLYDRYDSIENISPRRALHVPVDDTAFADSDPLGPITR